MASGAKPSNSSGKIGDTKRSNTSKNRTTRSSSQSKPKEINLVAVRSEAFSEAASLSRNMAADNYAATRAKRHRSKILTTVICVVLAAAVISVSSAYGVWYFVLKPSIENDIHRDLTGNVVNFNEDFYDDIFTPPPDPMAPFFMLLIGLDDSEGGTSRSDSLILLYVNPEAKQLVMISIPRDTRVPIPGYYTTKINAAYSFGAGSANSTGPALCVKTVSAFAGVDIAYFAEINFGGFVGLVDRLGGVTVDVPYPVNDREAGPSVLSAGIQVLNGEQALTFVRTRKTGDDYQRQANQRTFLMALARQVLSSSPTDMIAAIRGMTDSIHSNMSVDEIIGLAMAFRGFRESDIHTYSVPSTTAYIDNVSYVLANENNWRSLINAVKRGEYPDPASVGIDAYVGGTETGIGDTVLNPGDGILSEEQRSGFVIDVRNGWGYKGAASSVSDSLALAGYQQGEVSNTNSFVYHETLVVYSEEADYPAAQDIVIRLGFGRVIPSLGRYDFNGDVLVVVGEDYPHR